eukprot:TRINITY_DN1329_c6_g1_i1.p1 TRINITY_DN1329_c6_g1~~TRINITY_DN1329_c6_g1_i1.p1  ORF type:complete len:473 (+),score=106.09 TRINITY_DN1329_c6_g1_i1:53-1471(+)
MPKGHSKNINMHKRFHPKGHRTVEAVRKAEETDALEQRKRRDRDREAEKEREERYYKEMQESTTGVKTKERLDWIYEFGSGGKTQSSGIQMVSADQLLAKKADTGDFTAANDLANQEPVKKDAKAIAVDMEAKLREDPLLAIEMAKRARIESAFNDPMQAQKLRKLRKLQQEKMEREKKDKKKDKKKRKKDKKEKKRKKKRRHSTTDSDSSSEESLPRKPRRRHDSDTEESVDRFRRRPLSRTPSPDSRSSSRDRRRSRNDTDRDRPYQHKRVNSRDRYRGRSQSSSRGRNRTRSDSRDRPYNRGRENRDSRDSRDGYYRSSRRGDSRERLRDYRRDESNKYRNSDYDNHRRRSRDREPHQRHYQNNNNTTNGNNNTIPYRKSRPSQLTEEEKAQRVLEMQKAASTNSQMRDQAIRDAEHRDRVQAEDDKRVTGNVLKKFTDQVLSSSISDRIKSSKFYTNKDASFVRKGSE